MTCELYFSKAVTKQQRNPVAGKVIEVPEITSPRDRLGTSGLAGREGGGSGWDRQQKPNSVLVQSSEFAPSDFVCSGLLKNIYIFRKIQTDKGTKGVFKKMSNRKFHIQAEREE